MILLPYSFRLTNKTSKRQEHMTRFDINVIYTPCAVYLRVSRGGGCMWELLNLPTDTHKSEMCFGCRTHLRIHRVA